MTQQRATDVNGTKCCTAAAAEVADRKSVVGGTSEENPCAYDRTGLAGPSSYAGESSIKACSDGKIPECAKYEVGVLI